MRNQNGQCNHFDCAFMNAEGYCQVTCCIHSKYKYEEFGKMSYSETVIDGVTYTIVPEKTS